MHIEDSLNVAGLHLEEPCFSRSQLYVEESCVGEKTNLVMYCVVYKETYNFQREKNRGKHKIKKPCRKTSSSWRGLEKASPRAAAFYTSGRGLLLHLAGRLRPQMAF